MIRNKQNRYGSSSRKKLDLNAIEKYKLKEGWFSFATLFLAFMTVVTSIIGGDWQVGINILLGIGLVSFLLGFVLARTQFVPPILSHSFMLSVGMVFVGLQVFPYTDAQYTSWSEKLGSTVLAVIRWCQRALSGHEHDEGLVFLVGLGLLVWLLGYAVVWLSFRLHHPWWVLALLGTVLVVNLSYNPPNAFRSFAIYLLASLLYIIRVNVFLNEERWRRSRLFFRPGLWRSAMAVGSVITLLVTLLAFAAPSDEQANPIKHMMENLNSPLSGMQGGFGGFFVAPNGDKAHRDPLSANNFNSFDSSFTLGGPFTPSNDPVLKVSGIDPSYLQSNVLDQYDGLHWVNTYQSAPTLTDTETVFSPLALAPDQNLPSSNDKGRDRNEVTVTNLAPTGNSLFVGGDLIKSSISAILRYHYEPINIQNVPLQAFLKINGNGPLVDSSHNNKPVPPSLVPLLNNLYAAYKAGLPGLPPSIIVTYKQQGANWAVTYLKAGDSQQHATTATPTSDGYYSAGVGDWKITLPNAQMIQSLNRQVKPGNTMILNLSSVNPVLPASVFLATTDTPHSATHKLDSIRVYHATDGSWSFTYDPTIGLDSPAIAKQKFEATPAGQAIRTQIDDLMRQNQGMQIDYTVQANQPIAWTVNGFAPNYDDLVGANAQQIVQVGQSYVTTALRYRYDEQSLQQTGTDYPDWVKERYLQLPAALPDRIRQLTLQITDGYTNPYDKAKRIEDYLRSDTFKYTTDVTFVPPDRDFVDYFLFTSHEGYCTYFSTAMSVMLRSIGIPTREIEGFIGGEPNGDGTFIVRGKEAHAWPQVYFPGYGWVNFEPTPGPGYAPSNLPADPSLVAPIITPTPVVGGAPGSDPFATGTDDGATPGADNGPNKAKNRDIPDDTDTTSGSKFSNSPPPLWLLLSVLVILAIAGVVLTSKLWVASQLRLPVTTPEAVYARLQKTARKAHLEPRGGMTQYEYARYLSKKLPEATNSIKFITDRYVSARYGSAAVEQSALPIISEVAETKPPEIHTEGYVDSNKIWTRLRVQGEKHRVVVEIHDTWEAVQLALISYRRQRLKERLIPDVIRQLYAALPTKVKL
jgi:hypothetical protein